MPPKIKFLCPLFQFLPSCSFGQAWMVCFWLLQGCKLAANKSSYHTFDRYQALHHAACNTMETLLSSFQENFKHFPHMKRVKFSKLDVEVDMRAHSGKLAHHSRCRLVISGNAIAEV